MQAETIAMHELVARDEAVARRTSTGNVRSQSCKVLKSEANPKRFGTDACSSPCEYVKVRIRKRITVHLT